VTTAIQNHAFVNAARSFAAPGTDAQPLTSEALTLDPGTRSRLLQFARTLRGGMQTTATLIQQAGQLAKEGVGSLGPANLEVMCDAVQCEELGRTRQKERELLTGLRDAIPGAGHAQAELLRALQFLRPSIGLEEEEDVTAPGFTPPMKNPAELDTSGLIWDSHADFYAQISALLGVLQTEWLAKYQDAMSKFLDFYQELSDIMEKISVIADGDKGNVSIDLVQAHADLKKLIEDYGLDQNALANFPTEAAAEAFKQSLGLPGLTVTGPGEGGRYHVKMDLSAVEGLKESMEMSNGQPYPGRVIFDSARYNAWVSAKDSNMEQVKHVSKVLGEKLSEMTQKYDNIVKILSSTIDKITEADMSFVHGI
jgi:type III secretion system IpaD/SipD/SspD family effector